MTHGYFAGQLSPAAQAAVSNVPTVSSPTPTTVPSSMTSSSDPDLGQQFGSTLLNIFGQAANTLAQEGVKKLVDASSQVSPLQALATQISILGPKYGVYPGMTVSVATKGSFVGQRARHGAPVVHPATQSSQPARLARSNPYASSHPVHIGQTVAERSYHPIHMRTMPLARMGRNAVGQCIDPHDGSILPMYKWDDFGNIVCLDPHTNQMVDAQGKVITSGYATGANFGAPGTVVGQCVMPDGTILPIAGWDELGNVYCYADDGHKVDATGHAVSGTVVGQCVLPDGSILPIAGWDDYGNVYCLTPDGKKVDATGHAVGVQSIDWYDSRFGQ